MYMLWRHALMNPGSACYYITPEMAHGRKLVWTDPRLSTFGDSKYIKGLQTTEMIVKFNNGSFIQIIGSENFASANGLRPAILVYDEFCEFHPRFHETMQPNRMVYKCPLIIIGTPPMQDSRNKEQYIAYAEECKRDKESYWSCQDSYKNPHIEKAELDKEKEKLFARGEEYLWYSQYEAKITAGGKHVIFPMLDRSRHVHPHATLMEEISRDIRKLDWFCISDPGTTTVMGFLFLAVNPYSKRIYVLDEIYEKDQKRTSVQRVMPVCLQKADLLAKGVSFEDDWTKVYDEAAAWFTNEVMQQYGYYFMPTLKAHNKKENGISLIKDILVHNAVSISDRCEKLLWEMEQYIADSDGKFPKHHDHLIDCFRYFLAAANYSMVEVMQAARMLGAKVLGDPDPEGYQRRDDPWEGDDWTGWAD